MSDGSAATANLSLLDAMLGIACGATWVSIRTSGKSNSERQATRAIVADGTPGMKARAERVVDNDPAISAARQTDGKKPEATGFAPKPGSKAPR